MNRMIVLAAMISAATIVTPASAANIVTNGDFSNGEDGWNFVSFGTDPVNGGLAASTGCVGDGCTSTLGQGSFIQQFLPTTANSTYSLSFSVGENGGPNSDVSVFWDGQKVFDQLNPANNTLFYNEFNGDYEGALVSFTIANLVASSSSTSLEIHGRQDPAGLFVDNVSANLTSSVSPISGAVPEPATWALMILGMGAVGFAMRRRKNVDMTVRFA